MKLFHKSIKRFLRWDIFDNYCLMYYREKLCTFECQCLDIHNIIISNFLWCTRDVYTNILLIVYTSLDVLTRDEHLQWAVRIAHGSFSKVTILALLKKVRTAVDWIRWSGKRHNVRFLWHFPVYFCMNYNKLQRTTLWYRTTFLMVILSELFDFFMAILTILVF